MKKLRFILIAAVCALTAAIFCSCTKTPNYHRVIFDEIEGIVYETADGVPMISEVRDGYTLKFSVTVDTTLLSGEPKVMANGKQLKADAKGIYSLKITSPVQITVDGVFGQTKYTVKFDSGETRTRYTDVNGNELDERKITVGEELSFKVLPSVYFVGEPRVSANTTILQPDANGVYKTTVTDNTTVSVSNLEYDVPYRNRIDGGNGSAQEPFKISRPIDLYAMADDIATGFYLNAQLAHYELTNDIDMKGEQLYVIGDFTTETSFFAGTFEGNGYTIKNYFIDDSIIEQESYTEVLLPHVGLFGRVSSTISGRASISNLNLSGFEIEIDSSKYGGDYMVGGLVGFASGAQIVGCSVDGNIKIKGNQTIVNNEYTYTYAGGVVGAMNQVVDVNNGYAITGSIRSCANHTNITVLSGNVISVGGIIGTLLSYSEQVSTYVLNCYNTANLDGGYSTGGIVGTASHYVAIENCYNTGSVTARTATVANYGYNGLAYAGGIVGSVNYGSVVANCFSAGEVNAYSHDDNYYAFSDEIAGKSSSVGTSEESWKNPIVDSEAAVYNCYTSADSADFGKDFYKNTLNWLDGDWKFDGTYPQINFESSSITFKVTVLHGTDDEKVGETSITDTYMPLNQWYTAENGVPMFVDKGELRSYGYFFDKALSAPVPSSYVPVGNATFYVGLCSLTGVTGTYAINVDTPRANTAVTLELRGDGVLYYEYGARNGTSYYYYDAERIVLVDVGLDLHKSSSSNLSSYEGRINASGNLELFDALGKQQNKVTFTAIKVSPVFAYGEYSVDGVSYEFNRDGTGKRTDDNTVQTFKYTVTVDGEINFTAGGTEYTATVSGGSVTQINAVAAVKADAFAGVWRKSATQLCRYEFDGYGNYKFVEYTYGSDGSTVDGTTKQGTYTVNGSAATLGGDVTAMAVLDADGYLRIDGELYGYGDELQGVWVFNSNTVSTIEFYGISSKGFGKAKLDIGGSADEVTYSLRGNSVSVYLNEFSVCTLVYDRYNKTLGGNILGAEAVYFAYDRFRGSWVSSDTDIGSIEFNGLGSYNVNGTQVHLATRGSVKINGTTSVLYRLVGNDGGTFTYNGADYTFVCGSDGRITVSGNSKNATFARIDSMKGVVYADDNGNTYSFDGKGNLPEGGTLTVTSGSGSVTHVYRIDGDEISVDGSGSIVLNTATDRYDYTDGANTASLHIHTVFKGRWAVGKLEDVELVINDVGAQGTASGTYGGEDVTYNYNAALNTLTFEQGGINYTVSLLTATIDDETVYELRLTDGQASSVCIAPSKLDSFKGVYESENTHIVLDGLNNSVNARGTAVVTEKGEVMEISYEPDSYGRILFKYQGIVIYIFYPSADGEFVKNATGEHYVLVSPDRMYRRSVYEDAGQNTPNLNKQYVFDGVSKVYDGDGNLIYTYTLIEQTEDDKLKLVVRANFVSTTGVKYRVELNYGSGVYLLTMFELAE